MSWIHVIKQFFWDAFWKIINLAIRRFFVRRRFIEHLKNIVGSFSDCLAEGKTCSLENILRSAMNQLSTREVIHQDMTVNVKIDCLYNRLRVLSEWFRFFTERITYLNPKQASSLYSELGQIINHIGNITNQFLQIVGSCDLLTILKKDAYGFPDFRRIYTNVITEFENLGKTWAKIIKDIRPWCPTPLIEI